MKVSVIIPTYNEEKVILDCLESLGNQTLTDFEIIIVDDGSTDKTRELINNLQKQIPDLILLKQEHKGPGEARNLGAKEAKGKVLVFVDADMTFDENFLKELTQPILNGKEKGTFSKNEYVANWNNVWARCWNINQGWEKGKRNPTPKRPFLIRIYEFLAYSVTSFNFSVENFNKYLEKKDRGVFRAILKTEFENVGGFKKGGEYTDDWSLANKLGYLAKNVPGAKFYHQNPDSLSEVFRQAKWVGKRKYKWGLIGSFYALVCSSLPASILIGMAKSVFYLQPLFLIFKIFYDLGVFIGIIEYLLFKKGAK